TASTTTGTTTTGGDRSWSGTVDFDIADRQIRPRQPGARLNDVCWEFHATEVFVSRVSLLSEHIADQQCRIRVVVLRFNLRDHILIIDVSRKCVRHVRLALLIDLKRYDCVFLALNIALSHGGVAGC